VVRSRCRARRSRPSPSPQADVGQRGTAVARTGVAGCHRAFLPEVASNHCAVELATLDLTGFNQPSISSSVDLFVEPPGQVNAIALTFRAELYEGISHTLDPWT
jgi:hypothetical protein